MSAFTQVPDKDHGLICGECKVLVDNFDSTYQTCDGYCASIGKTCVGAWEENEIGLEDDITIPAVYMGVKPQSRRTAGAADALVEVLALAAKYICFTASPLF